MEGEVTISLNSYNQLLKDLARVDSLAESFDNLKTKYQQNLEDIGKLSNFLMTLAQAADSKRANEAIELFNKSSSNLEANVDEDGKLRYSAKGRSA